MNFNDTIEEAGFRAQVRAFIQQHHTEELQSFKGSSNFLMGVLEGPGVEAFKVWRAALGQRGWIAPHWPVEYGGAGLSPIEQFIFNQEMASVRAPMFGGPGAGMIGPTLIIYGTDEQKQRHLPGIAAGNVGWCQGYSEPGAGSDLASLQTRAVRDGDDYIVNGQKIWTSGAHLSQWMFLLTRTDPDAPKHRGISMLLLDLATPGITVRPLVNMANHHGFNEVFFDNVRIPAANRVGEENRGWYVGATLLDFERSGIADAVGLQNEVEDLVAFVRQTPAPAVQLTQSLRLELADRTIEALTSQLFAYRIISLQKRGQVPNYEASVNKNFRAETRQRLARTGMRVTGLYGGLWQGTPYAANDGAYAYDYLSSVPATIAAGSAEINRNVIATRGLGLPRG